MTGRPAERLSRGVGRWPALSLLAMFFLAHAVVAAGTAAARDENDLLIVGVCARCHGYDGVSGDHLVPNLAGQRMDYLVEQLRLFFRSTDSAIRKTKSYNRFHGVMSWIGRELTDDDMHFLARYYTNLPCAPPAGRPAAGPPVIAACDACHAGGVMFGDVPAPNLNAQKRDYLLLQLMALRDSARGEPAEVGKPFRSHRNMGKVVAGFTNKQIADLAHYYSHSACEPRPPAPSPPAEPRR